MLYIFFYLIANSPRNMNQKCKSIDFHIAKVAAPHDDLPGQIHPLWLPPWQS